MFRDILYRFSNLPSLSFANLLRFAAYRHFYKKLVAKKIIDADGSLMQSRFSKASAGRASGAGHRHLVCITGFGWSGSGAVRDVLEEYDNTTVTYPLDGQGTKSHCPEFDLLKAAGGLFELERAFEDGNIFIRDAAVRLFLSLVRNLYIDTPGLYNDDFIVATREFLDGIMDFKSVAHGGYGFCHNYAPLGKGGERLVFGSPCEEGGTGYLFYLKDLTRQEFRVHAKAYLSRVFGTFPSKDYLVLDQALSDYQADLAKYRDYLGPFKLICVFRDPRDVYAMKLNNPSIDWIPSEPTAFVKWYEHAHRKSLSVRSDDFMMVFFGDLFTDYEGTVRRIENFVGLDSSQHVRPKTKFDPAVSIKNVGIYKAYENDPRMKIVSEGMPEFVREALK